MTYICEFHDVAFGVSDGDRIGVILGLLAGHEPDKQTSA